MSRRRKAARQRSERSALPAAGRVRFDVLAAFALILPTTLLVYLPSLNGAQIWDDDSHITKPELQSLRGLSRIWFDVGATQQYYPLLHSAFWLEHKLWGQSVLGYHLVNVLWHMISVTLLYFVLERLKIPGALLATAIFALHPVMVESVAWISEQKNTLSAVFYLSAMLVYLEFDHARRRSQYFLALGLFVLGLVTKTVTATLPAALLVIFWWQRGRLSWNRDVRPLVPFFVLGASAGVLTAWVERTLIGAAGVDFELSFLQRALLAGRAIWFYLSKLLWPANLTFIYPRWEIDPAVWWQWLFPAAALAVLILLWSRRRKSRGPLAAWLYFCGTLFPVLGFLNVYPFIYSFAADHFQYLASLGMIVLASAGAAQGIKRLPQPARRLGGALCLLLVASLSVLTFRQSSMYADSITLYQTIIDRDPNCWMAHNNLGLELCAKRNSKDAIEHYRAALQIRPGYADAHANLGNALTSVGRLPEAIDEFQTALALKPGQPLFLSNLAIALMSAGRLGEAIEKLQAALKLNPDDPLAHNNLAVALMQSDRLSEATEHLQAVLRLRPDFAEAHINLGNILAGAGQYSQAIEQFSSALKLDPQSADAHFNWGNVLVSMGDTDEAIAHYVQAAQLRTDRADVQNNLADVLRQTGRPDLAVEHYQQALRLKPDFLPACAGLAKAFSLLGRSNEAVATAKKAIELAHSTGRDEVERQLDEWLQHYQAELQHASESGPSTR